MPLPSKIALHLARFAAASASVAAAGSSAAAAAAAAAASSSSSSSAATAWGLGAGAGAAGVGSAKWSAGRGAYANYQHLLAQAQQAQPNTIAPQRAENDDELDDDDNDTPLLASSSSPSSRHIDSSNCIRARSDRRGRQRSRPIAQQQQPEHEQQGERVLVAGHRGDPQHRKTTVTTAPLLTTTNPQQAQLQERLGRVFAAAGLPPSPLPPPPRASHVHTGKPAKAEAETQVNDALAAYHARLVRQGGRRRTVSLGALTQNAPFHAPPHAPPHAHALHTSACALLAEAAAQVRADDALNTRLAALHAREFDAHASDALRAATKRRASSELPAGDEATTETDESRVRSGRPHVSAAQQAFFERALLLRNTLLHMHSGPAAAQRLLADFCALFPAPADRWVGGYNVVMEVLLAAHAQARSKSKVRPDEVVQLYLQMIQDGLMPNARTLSSVIDALCRNPAAQTFAPKDHHRGSGSGSSSSKQPLSNYAQAVSLLRAAHASRRRPYTLAPYHALLRAAAKRADEATALEALALLEAHPAPMRPNATTFELLLACFAGGESVLQHALRPRAHAACGTGDSVTLTQPETKLKVVRSIFQDFLAQQQSQPAAADEANADVDADTQAALAPASTMHVWHAFINALFLLGDVPGAMHVLGEMLQRASTAAALSPQAGETQSVQDAGEEDAHSVVLLSVAPAPNGDTMDVMLAGLLHAGQFEQAAEWYAKISELAAAGLAQPSGRIAASVATALAHADATRYSPLLRRLDLDARTPAAPVLLQAYLARDDHDAALELVNRIPAAAAPQLHDVLVALVQRLTADGRTRDAAGVFQRTVAMLVPASRLQDSEAIVSLALHLTQPSAGLVLSDALEMVALPLFERSTLALEPESELLLNLVTLYYATPDAADRISVSDRALSLLIRAFAAHLASVAVSRAEAELAPELRLLLQDAAQRPQAQARSAHQGLDWSPLADILHDRYGADGIRMLAPFLDPSYRDLLAAQPWRVASSSGSPSPPASFVFDQTSGNSASGDATSVASSGTASGSPPLPHVHVIDEDLSERLAALTKHWDTNTLPQILDLLNAALAVGDYPTPQVLSGLINYAGRMKDVPTLDYFHSIATHVLGTASGSVGWKVDGWRLVESSMMGALAHADQFERANLQRHSIISSGQVPSADAYAALIAVIKDTTDDALIAQELFDESQRLGVRPNVYLFNTIISKLSRARKADRALQLFAQMQALGIRPSSVSYGAAINACTRIGDEAKARELFHEMESDRGFRPRVPPYNCMIQFYVHTQPDKKKAMFYLDKLRQARVQPSAHTYKLILDLHGTIEPVDERLMHEAFEEIVQNRQIPVQGTHWASLITSHGVALKDLPRAEQIFQSIAQHPSSLRGGQQLPDAVCYEALLAVYAAHNEIPRMRQQLAAALDKGIRPTAYLANVFIKALGRAGPAELDEARAIFFQMIDPAVGVAAAGNHGPRTHGAGALATPDAQAMSQRDSARLPPLDPAYPWRSVFREPSTYEEMIRAELNANELHAAHQLLHRMEARAFPPPLVLHTATLISDAEARVAAPIHDAAASSS
ncbi:hypothetical protein K437DRAFT_239287 [Tilletiaria anomala UBC 951]|uniref:PROP1-like PPR domain-containing protein n=1 Tax=Tilletiaria anomala (strain ATCC 24038 / CBS 436.72 / UBC 951) TaxID=1037660 RepID=A0A066VDC8_TILAU|nr:uncharacterized protein K437DRAFT_239287 [Tilletiaria anomala UBC 951]KDN39747.1 hypothetical protein K437DRAFT_239287 [Tilletiaria anomala UBC 951]